MRTHFSRAPNPLLFHSRGGLSYSCLSDGTGEPNTWNQFAGLRTGYWFPQRVYTGKIALFNSPCGWVSSHTPLSQADWVRYMDSCCFFRGVEKMSKRSDCYLELKDCMCFLETVCSVEGIFFFFQECALSVRWTLGEKFSLYVAQYQEDNGGDWPTTKINKYISGSYLKWSLLQLTVIYCFQNCKAQSMHIICVVLAFIDYMT